MLSVMVADGIEILFNPGFAQHLKLRFYFENYYIKSYLTG